MSIWKWLFGSSEIKVKEKVDVILDPLFTDRKGNFYEDMSIPQKEAIMNLGFDPNGWSQEQVGLVLNARGYFKALENTINHTFISKGLNREGYNKKRNNIRGKMIRDLMAHEEVYDTLTRWNNNNDRDVPFKTGKLQTIAVKIFNKYYS